MPDRTPAAVALIRLDIPVADIDLHAVAERYGCRLLHTVRTNARPFVAAHALARYAAEYDARAVIVPGLAHAADIRRIITENAALITPNRVYPRGYRWHGEDFTCRGER
ncbi:MULTISPECIES: hypothetical protein [Nocardia]|uniref:hypothetical protein n=1 Tax=Nocardia TaxID=1817 RepID=UPI001E2900DA|nr:MULTISPECIES: hypothetical protein [Nocardia]